MEDFDIVVTDEDRKWYKSLCEVYLGSKWIGLSEDEFSVELLSGGMCNRLFLCTNKSLQKAAKNGQVPAQVIVRLYGHPFVGKRGDLIYVTEPELTFLSCKLETLGIGAKIYGIFTKGRIEEYIPHVLVDRERRYQKDVIRIVSQKLALIHTFTVPISKNVNAIFDLTLKIYDQNQLTFESRMSELEFEERQIVQQLLNLDVHKEIEWLKSNAPKLHSPQVFCHNDLKFGNIGIRSDKKLIDEQVFIFDFENCSYGYRGFDVGFLLLSFEFDFTRNQFWEHLKFPSEEVINQVLDEYLKEWERLSAQYNPEIDNREHLLMECQFCIMFFYLLYYAAIHKRLKSPLTQAFVPFASSLKTSYLTSKQNFIQMFAEVLNE